MCFSYNSCTTVKIIDVAPLYCLLKHLHNLWLKFAYILNVCLQLAVIGVVYRGPSIGPTTGVLISP
jgi:hypothetical protein